MVDMKDGLGLLHEATRSFSDTAKKNVSALRIALNRHHIAIPTAPQIHAALFSQSSSILFSPTSPVSSSPGQFSPGQFSPGQFSPGQFSPGQFSPGQFSPGQFSPGAFSNGQFSPGPFSPGPLSPSTPDTPGSQRVRRSGRRKTPQKKWRNHHDQKQCIVGGLSCHQCKSLRHVNQLSYCHFEPSERYKTVRRCCRKKYCSKCLHKFYQESPPGDVTCWSCPSCRDICCCAACRRRYSPEKRQRIMEELTKTKRAKEKARIESKCRQVSNQIEGKQDPKSNRTRHSPGGHRLALLQSSHTSVQTSPFRLSSSTKKIQTTRSKIRALPHVRPQILRRSKQQKTNERLVGTARAIIRRAHSKSTTSVILTNPLSQFDTEPGASLAPPSTPSGPPPAPPLPPPTPPPTPATTGTGISPPPVLQDDKIQIPPTPRLCDLKLVTGKIQVPSKRARYELTPTFACHAPPVQSTPASVSPPVPSDTHHVVSDVDSPMANVRPPVADISSVLSPSIFDAHPPAINASSPAVSDTQPPIFCVSSPASSPVVSDTRPPIFSVSSPMSSPTISDTRPSVFSVSSPMSSPVSSPMVSDVHPPASDVHPPASDAHPPASDVLGVDSSVVLPGSVDSLMTDVYPPVTEIHSPVPFKGSMVTEVCAPASDLDPARTSWCASVLTTSLKFLSVLEEHRVPFSSPEEVMEQRAMVVMDLCNAMPGPHVLDSVFTTQ